MATVQLLFHGSLEKAPFGSILPGSAWKWREIWTTVKEKFTQQITKLSQTTRLVQIATEIFDKKPEFGKIRQK